MMGNNEIAEYIDKKLHSYNSIVTLEKVDSRVIKRENPPEICKSMMILKEPQKIQNKPDFCSLSVLNDNNFVKETIEVDIATDDNDPHRYRYRDFSQVKSTKENIVEPALKYSYCTYQNKIRNFRFPQKLHQILSDKNLESIITWLPHGRAFKIVNPSLFEKKVLPMYFQHDRLSSFLRQLSSWGFRRITYNQYYHEMFLVSMPHLCHHMKRLGKELSVKRKKEDKERILKQFHKFCSMHPITISKREGENSDAAAISTSYRRIETAATKPISMSLIYPSNSSNVVKRSRITTIEPKNRENMTAGREGIIRRYKYHKGEKSNIKEREAIIRNRVVALNKHRQAKLAATIANEREKNMVSMKISREELTAVLAMKKLSSSTLA